MSALEFSSLVKGGKLEPAKGKKLVDVLAKMEGQRVMITVAEDKPKRSSQANRYYFGVVVKLITEMFREAGNYVDAEDVHLLLKEHVGKLKHHVVTKDGEVITVLGSTRKMTNAEFSAYVESVIAWAAEMGLEIPSSEEYLTKGER